MSRDGFGSPTARWAGPTDAVGDASPSDTELESGAAGLDHASLLTYDDQGRITREVELLEGQCIARHYRYEPVTGRLAEAAFDEDCDALEGMDGALPPDADEHWSYAYDVNGNRVCAEPGLGPCETAAHDVIVVDAHDRLRSAVGVTYSYDAAGTLISRREGTLFECYDYDVFGGLVRYDRYTLDEEDDESTCSSQRSDAQHDAWIEYTNDPLGRRVERFAHVRRLVNDTFAAHTTRWAYQDALNPIAELDGALVVGNGRWRAQPPRPGARRRAQATQRVVEQRRRRTWSGGDARRDCAARPGRLPNNRVRVRYVYATHPWSPDVMVEYPEDGGEPIWHQMLRDHRGSVRGWVTLVRDADGTLTRSVHEHAAYDPWGQRPNAFPALYPGEELDGELTSLGFAGGIYDPITGLVRFGARDYDPRAGRWTAKDPIGFAGGDTLLYGYVGGDPVSFVDPTGENPWVLGGAAVGGCGLNMFALSVGDNGQHSSWDYLGACVTGAGAGAAATRGVLPAVGSGGALGVANSALHGDHESVGDALADMAYNGCINALAAGVTGGVVWARMIDNSVTRELAGGVLGFGAAVFTSGANAIWDAF